MDTPRTLDVGPSSSDDSVSFAVKTIVQTYGEVLPGDDPADIILEEKLDEKDSLLMDGRKGSANTVGLTC